MQIAELDGTRIITNDFCEFVESVPRDTNEVFGQFSESSPASILLDATNQLEMQSPKADDYIQLIKNNLTEAVDTCVSCALLFRGFETSTDNPAGECGWSRIQASLAETTFKGGLIWQVGSRHI
jgi:hypothetical protein